MHTITEHIIPCYAILYNIQSDLHNHPPCPPASLPYNWRRLFFIRELQAIKMFLPTFCKLQIYHVYLTILHASTNASIIAQLFLDLVDLNQYMTGPGAPTSNYYSDNLGISGVYQQQSNHPCLPQFCLDIFSNSHGCHGSKPFGIEKTLCDFKRRKGQSFAVR